MSSGGGHGVEKGESVVAPAVVGADLGSGDEADVDELPSTVFVPTEPVTPSEQQARVELRYTVEGALALLTFTSLERLVDACGERQAWIAVPGAELPRLAVQVGAEVVLQDFALPEAERRTEER